MEANTRCERKGLPYGGLRVAGGDERRFFTENGVAIMCVDPAVTPDLHAMRCTGAASTGAVTLPLVAISLKLNEATKHVLARKYCEGAK